MLADAKAVDDLKLLIERSYGLSYVQDGDARLSISTRLRLAFLGNAFEFAECVQECLQSLSEEDLTIEDTFSLLDEMPASGTLGAQGGHGYWEQVDQGLVYGG